MTSRGKLLCQLACSSQAGLHIDEESIEIPITRQSSSNEDDDNDEEEDPFAGDHSNTDPDYEPSISSVESSLDSVSIGRGLAENEQELGDEYILGEADENLDQLQRDVWLPIEDQNPVNIREYCYGPIVNVDPELCKTPSDIFKLFINEGIINLIVVETNKYASQQISTGISGGKSRLRSWQETNKQEMYKFFGIIICMGLVRVPTINHYWAKNDLYKNKYIASKMTRDRFLLLLQHIHFNNNENILDSNDRLYRIRPLLNLLNSRFETLLTPRRDVVIDESMVPWRGRLGMRQYIKNKRHKYGVKLYKLCTVEGYTYTIKIYSGKENNQNDAKDSHTVKVVMSLMDTLMDNGRSLYADNFYSSIQLVKKLQERNTYYCGTLRSNRRGIPKEFVKSKLSKNQEAGIHNSNGIKIIKWQDKRMVLMISNKRQHNINMHETGKRNRSGELIVKPQAVIDYNKAKKGVDISDQMSSYYTTLRKGLKWYRKVAFELIFGAALVNAHLVYNELHKHERKLNMLQFRERTLELTSENFVENVIENWTQTTARKKMHTLQVEPGPGRKRRRNCVDCYKNLRQTLSSREADKKVTNISTFCAECPNNAPLCLNCFNERHAGNKN